MKAVFEIPVNQLVTFEIPEEIPPPEVTHIHNCCPFGWGTIFELKLSRFDEAGALYDIVSSRSEKP